MFLKGCSFLAREILNKNCVGVDIDGLIADDQLLEFALSILSPRDGNCCVTDFKTMSPHSEELILSWIRFGKLDEEKSNSRALFVG